MDERDLIVLLGIIAISGVFIFLFISFVKTLNVKEYSSNRREFIYEERITLVNLRLNIIDLPAFIIRRRT